MSLNLFATSPVTEPVNIPGTPTSTDGVTPLSATPHHIFIATDLSRVEYAGSDNDILLDQRVYRRLTPDYYVWLRSRMEMASRKHVRGLLPDANYLDIRERFNAMHDEAVTLFGEERLLKIMATCNPDRYLPPMREYAVAVAVNGHGHVISPEMETGVSPFAPGRTVCSRDGSWQAVVTRIHPADEYFPSGWVEVRANDGTTGQADVRYLVDPHGCPLIEQMIYTDYELRAIELARNERPEDFDDLLASLPNLTYPPDGEWPFTQPVDFDDFIKVDAVSATAKTQGWSHPDLFQNRGRFAYPYGQDYGLICSVRHRTIGVITPEAIELLPEQSGGSPLKFYRPRRATQEG